MEHAEQFWEQVVLYIQKEYKQGHPSKWKANKIKEFLLLFGEQLREKCKDDKYLTQLLELPVENGQINYHAIKVPSYSTFLRIFKSRKSNGKTYVKNLFAIYLGYRSYNDFLSKNGFFSKEVTIISTHKTIPFKKDKEWFNTYRKKFMKTSLISSFKWMMAWLLISTISHNVIGLIKGNMDQPNWKYFFWIPPIIIAFIFYSIGKQLIRKDNGDFKRLSIIWWLSIFTQIIVNQWIPGWRHFILTASLLLIGVVGQMSLSTKLAYILTRKSKRLNEKHQFVNYFKADLNIAIAVYSIGLFLGFLLVGMMWVVPDKQIGAYGDNIIIFRWLCSIEMIAFLVLITLGFRKLIFNPIIT